MDRREAIRVIDELLANRDNDSRYPCVSSPRHYEALDLAIEALEREIEYGQMVVDLTKGEKVDDWVYDEDESATTTDCNYTCSDCKHQDKTYEQEPCHSCFNNDGAGYEPDTDCISRQQAIEAFCDDCRGLKPGQCEHWDKCKSQKALRSLPPVTPTEHKTTETMMVDGEPTEIDPLSYEVGYTHGQKERTKKLYIPLDEYTVERVNRLHKDECGEYFDEEWLYNELEQLAVLI